MTARMRRLMSDYEQVMKDFAGHQFIKVTPVGTEPPEQYHVTYFVNGIYLLPDGRIETLGRHEVEITLHADYPRYKPICRILTPIWHPNFRDGQICIGDIWGAGESLTDIIINIGDMIQYKSWNASSPLSADAAKWAIENRHLFPVGTINLYNTDYASAAQQVDITLPDEADALPPAPDEPPAAVPAAAAPQPTPLPAATPVRQDDVDFVITAEELRGVTFVPVEQRMQTAAHGGAVKRNKINFKTILVKGILWAMIGAMLGFGVSELTSLIFSSKTVASLLGQNYMADYYSYTEKADKEFNAVFAEYKQYCKDHNISANDTEAFRTWLSGNAASAAGQKHLEQYGNYTNSAESALQNAYQYEFASSESKLMSAQKRNARLTTAFWSSAFAVMVGLFLGIGEGVFYGSAENAVKYALIGAGVSLCIAFLSGDLAQMMYAAVISNEASLFVRSLVRGVGWAIMGLGTGLAIGLIKPELKRILFCSIGGLAGAFIGGFLFNYISNVIPNDVVARGVALLIMGLLIGVGVGLLEQFAKAAWLKVIRGEFEGKEYLVFAGTTSIGNNGKNTIVLFKDKLVGPHHCDIKLEGSKYVLTDCGTPMGTVVNGTQIKRHILRQGDAIAIGNSVLVFNTK